jgi:hypothetical protein
MRSARVARKPKAQVPVVELIQRVPLESEIEEYLDQRVVANGGMTEKHTTPGRRGPPDRLITWPPGTFDHGIGRMDLAELKRPKGGVLSELQKRDHERRARFGIKVWLLYTKEAVDNYIAIKLGNKAR